MGEVPLSVFGETGTDNLSDSASVFTVAGKKKKRERFPQENRDKGEIRKQRKNKIETFISFHWELKVKRLYAEPKSWKSWSFQCPEMQL